MTNGDKIRAMSDEELADFLDKCEHDACSNCCDNFENCRRNNAPEPICKNHYLNWLKTPTNPPTIPEWGNHIASRFERVN